MEHLGKRSYCKWNITCAYIIFLPCLFHSNMSFHMNQWHIQIVLKSKLPPPTHPLNQCYPRLSEIQQCLLFQYDLFFIFPRTVPVCYINTPFFICEGLLTTAERWGRSGMGHAPITKRTVPLTKNSQLTLIILNMSYFQDPGNFGNLPSLFLPDQNESMEKFKWGIVWKNSNEA